MLVDSDLSFVSAFFTIYAYEALRDELERAGRLRFLFGEPSSIGVQDPGENAYKSFSLNEDGGIELEQVLAQKPLARDCAAWIRKQVKFKSINKANFLHGKLYYIEKKNSSATLVGSSNFTRRGMGLGKAPNVELNVEISANRDRVQLLKWFNNLWSDSSLTSDVTDDVLNALERLYQPYPPEFVFYKTLFHIFETWLERHGERDDIIDGVHLYDTEIWKALYAFQKDGAVSAINQLIRHNGCIIADSVGLGKTWTALAVIKFFELRNERVLVLCPKRLEDNWIRFTSWAGLRDNPFESDRLNYSVRAHTDLSRYKGQAGVVNLQDFNWGTFDLIVIDESHNFRNEGRDQTDDDGTIIKRSRYNRLLEEVLRGGVQTKVLMLSATPVNTGLRDLRNQIYLMTEKRQDAFRSTLGISNIESMFGVAQRAFQQWETSNPTGNKRNKSELLSSLGVDFLSLLDAVSLARSRSHIRRFYPEVVEELGGFPQRAKPHNLYPKTDTRNELSYDEIHRRIQSFRLAVYMPSQYLKDKTTLDAEKAKLNFDQRDRERFLIGMMRVNLLKRLESSVYAYTLTTSRILEKVDSCLRLISQWRMHGLADQLDLRPEEDEEDEDFAIGKGRRYTLNELDIDLWEKDLCEDRKVFGELHRQAKQVSVDRDDKLSALKVELKRKVETAPLNNDGRANRKVLVFTTFADTAQYLYSNLSRWVRKELGVHIALVTGGNDNRSTIGTSQYIDIVSRFAPTAQKARVDEEIDIVIATDCLSEGQNLQDCDLVVNYDIHWNPVRLMQRFGRIDRLGSRNKEVGMTNFWPTADLDRYLDLKSRVEARMALADAAATGLDDPLSKDTQIDGEEKTSELELAFRDNQLVRIREEVLDIEEVDDGVSLTDLTLDDFVADLLNYIQKNRKALENAPFGIHAIVQKSTVGEFSSLSPGVIFCLKHDGEASARTPNRTWPHFLVYVHEDGRVRYTFQHVSQCLTLFRALAVGKSGADQMLEDAFDQETQQGQDLGKYTVMLEGALRDISTTFKRAELKSLKENRDAILLSKPEDSSQPNHFTLITWLIIAKESS